MHSTNINCVRIDSDDFGPQRRQQFEDAFCTALHTHDVVFYDKNVPDDTGIARLTGVVSKAKFAFRVEYVFVVPMRLGEEEIAGRN